MRIYNPNDKPTSEFTEYLKNRLKDSTPPSSDPGNEPCYITEEMQKQLMEEGNWALPPAIQRRLDQENSNIDNIIKQGN